MEKTITKKTAKYYRDIFNGGNISLAISVLPEVIKKFGSKRWASSKGNDRLCLKKFTEFEWNHQIEGFFITDNGGVCADIYWQGDSTDGSDSEYVDTLRWGKTIPAKHEWLGDRTYYTHSDIRISREEFENAIRAVGKFLAPDEVKARKVAKARGDNSDKVFSHIDKKREGLDRWEMNRFWNGRYAVQKLLENDKSLLDKPFEELQPIVDKVFKKNNREFGYYEKKEYDLTY